MKSKSLPVHVVGSFLALKYTEHTDPELKML